MSDNKNNNIPEEEVTQQDINILKKVRLEKLDELKAKNANPYEITKFEVTGKTLNSKPNMKQKKKRLLKLQTAMKKKLLPDLTK